MNYKYLEVCAGCGGLSYGLELAGLIPEVLIEIDKTCVKTLESNFPKTKIICDDMRNINFKKYNGLIDIVVGGIPCQSFSIAGQRKGLEDENKGGLFYDFLRCLEEIDPHMFMIENVEGLKNINGGETLKFILNELENLGYSVVYQVLNAVNYLVPQKRKRLIIIGTKFNIEFNYPKSIDKVLTMKDALLNVPKSEGTKYSPAKKKILDLVPPGGCWIDLPKSIQKEYLGKSYESGGGKRGIARRLSWNEPCLTLTTSPCQKQTERCHPDQTRPFTIREYARIQTFPDNFMFQGSISSIYKQIGNAVPCMLAFFIGKEIIKCLNHIYMKSYIYSLLFKKTEKDTYNILNNISNIDNMLSHDKLKQLFTNFYREQLLPIYKEKTVPTDIDNIKKLIDIGHKKITEKEWIHTEKKILESSKIQQKIGYLHEYILSNIDGWQKCKDYKKHQIPADIMKKDKTIFLELKNKHNTMNSGARKSVINNLIKIKKDFPDAIVALGIIHGVGAKSYIKKIKNDQDIEIYEYVGDELVNLISGQKNLFKMLENIILEYFDANNKSNTLKKNTDEIPIKVNKSKKNYKKFESESETDSDSDNETETDSDSDNETETDSDSDNETETDSDSD